MSYGEYSENRIELLGLSEVRVNETVGTVFMDLHEHHYIVIWTSAVQHQAVIF
jgi:hypothetical protein